MKKQLLFLMGMLTITVIMAQTSNTVVIKNGTTETTYQDVSGYDGPCNCSNPMSSDEFNQMLTQIKTRKTDKELLLFAKTQIRDKCLLTPQVEEITLLFMFDINRCDFVKFAKTYTYDLANYTALRIKYTIYMTTQDYGQLYNSTEFSHNQYPGRYINELNQSYLPNGRIVEIERDNYYRGGSPPE
jgi:hypothetical protein